MPISDYIAVPGRGLLTNSAITYRKDYLKELGFDISEIEKSGLNHVDIQNNIESLIGSVEIPSAIIGPLSYIQNGKPETVFCVGATLEGALIASMNRGAKAISQSGGFTAEYIHQKMIRTPLFLLENAESAVHFENWIRTKFVSIKKQVEAYSNHASLETMDTYLEENQVHVTFVYSTGDAAGQNMTTTCTWHGILWMVQHYEKEGFEKIEEYVLEGNGSSDKKVSQFLIDHGRGIRVTAQTILQEEVIHQVLRTSSEQLLRFYGPSRTYAKRIGMLGYNINVANAVAAIFAATGQDLASIHESSVADLFLAKHPEGLEVKLTLYSLVVGTLGGGTHLPKQQEALKVMGCAGNNKVQRFASLIAGFAMGLELSTYSAMVSGEFAKAHEKLGRNRPMDWLQWHELDNRFLSAMLKPLIKEEITGIEILKGEVDNGILMNLCKKVNRKLIGFIPVDVITPQKTIPLLFKSKSTDLELIKGLHIMAASIDPALSDLITAFKKHLEHMGSHLKELRIPAFLWENGLHLGPEFYHQYIQENREIFILIQERLFPDDMEVMDSENMPEQWTEERIKLALFSIHQVHAAYLDPSTTGKPTDLKEFDIRKSIPLYEKLLEIVIALDPEKEEPLLKYLKDVSSKHPKLPISKTLVHNDYNPRNVAIRKNGKICIYDWELAVLNYPHRDIIEFLSFTLPVGFEKDTLFFYLKYHHALCGGDNNVSWEVWKEAYCITLKEYLLSRVSFYGAAEVVMKLKFVDRIFTVGVQMINFLEDEST